MWRSYKFFKFLNSLWIVVIKLSLRIIDFRDVNENKLSGISLRILWLADIYSKVLSPHNLSGIISI